MGMILLMISLLCAFLYIVGMRITPNTNAFKILERCLLGSAILYVFNLIGSFFGVTVGINPLSSLITGLLGAPGLILMVVVRLMP